MFPILIATHNDKVLGLHNTSHVMHNVIPIRIPILMNYMHLYNVAQEVLFEAPPNANCACQGDMLVYRCRVVGPGSTKWNGTAFSCNDNEIILRHSVYGGPGGASGECNSGAIIGRSVEVAGNRYTSQLSVSASDKVSSNTTVRCVYNGNTAEVIGTSTLMIVSGTLYVYYSSHHSYVKECI